MQQKTSEDPQDQASITPQKNAVVDPHQMSENAANSGGAESKQSFFYTQDQEDDPGFQLPLVDDQDNLIEQSAPFVLPFQNSASMPTVTQVQTQGAQGSVGTSPSAPTVRNTQGARRQNPFRIVKLLLLVSVVLIVTMGAGFFVFAQQASPPNPMQQVHQTTTTSPVPTVHPTPGPSAKTKAPTVGSSPQALASPSPHQVAQGNPQQGSGTQGQGIESLPSAQLLSQIGWTQAHLSLGDAVEALRTGATFTDREMSYDYRNIGTPANHSGTLTGATFLLTSGEQVRFVHNDVRIINNVLYNKVSTGKMIQQVVNAQPTLVQFQTIQIQGKPHLFAWVNVTFELFQSQVDPASGQRTEQLVTNAATGQPLVHQMAVVLVRVAPQNQGTNAPMGGTGWLVNTYALDAHTLPAIATDPSI